MNTNETIGSVVFIDLVQTRNFSCSELNVRDLRSLFDLICIKFGILKVRRLKRP